MPNLQQEGFQREKLLAEAEAKELPKLKDALSKLSFKDLSNEDDCFALLTEDFPAVRRNAFHDAYIVALDAADVREQAAAKKKPDAAPANKANTGGEVTKGGAATPTSSSGTKPPSPPVS